MGSEAKKTIAVVMACDNKYAFALGAALISLQKNAPLLLTRADIIVYTSGLSQQNHDALISICPITFHSYAPGQEFEDIPALARYSALSLARYECFALLREYQNVLWLDSDIYAAGELADIFGLCGDGIALARDLNLFAFNFLKKPPLQANWKAKNFNSGVMLLKQESRDFDMAPLREWCYQQTLALAPYLRWPDQAILNLALQKVRLPFSTLPAAYNAHPFSAPIPCHKALLLHAMGDNKFWTNCPLPAWQEAYQDWLALGGEAMPPAPRNPRHIRLFESKLRAEKSPFLWAIFDKINHYKFKKLNKKMLVEVLHGS